MNGWPDGRNGTRTCRCTEQLVCDVPARWLIDESKTPNRWWSIIAAAEATPACSWVR